MKEIAPSGQLRTWFRHDPGKWPEFKKRYFEELRGQSEALNVIREKQTRGPVTFVFASRELEFNNAVALRAYLKRRSH